VHRFIHTLALSATLVAIIFSLGRDYGLWLALKRAVVSYLAFFFVGSLLALVYRAGVLAESRQEPSQAQPGPQEKKRDLNQERVKA
jgi:hypothetical protein